MEPIGDEHAALEEAEDEAIRLSVADGASAGLLTRWRSRCPAALAHESGPAAALSNWLTDSRPESQVTERGSTVQFSFVRKTAHAEVRLSSSLVCVSSTQHHFVTISAR